MFTPLSPERQQRLRDIKLLILDVDGVLTSAQLFIGSSGEVIKAFNTLDGYGIKMLQNTGVQTAIITARNDSAVAHRAVQLGINHYLHGVENKQQAFAQLCAQIQIAAQETAFVGDDVIDLPIMTRCGFPFAVANAHAYVKEHALYTTQKSGGFGAVREITDLIMHAQNTLSDALAEYTK